MLLGACLLLWVPPLNGSPARSYTSFGAAATASFNLGVSVAPFTLCTTLASSGRPLATCSGGWSAVRLCSSADVSNEF